MATCVNCWTGGLDPDSTECPACGYNPSRRLRRTATRRLLIGILITACGLTVLGAGLSAHLRASKASPMLDY